MRKIIISSEVSESSQRKIMKTYYFILIVIILMLSTLALHNSAKVMYSIKDQYRISNNSMRVKINKAFKNKVLSS